MEAPGCADIEFERRVEFFGAFPEEPSPERVGLERCIPDAAFVIDLEQHMVEPTLDHLFDDLAHETLLPWKEYGIVSDCGQMERVVKPGLALFQ